MPSHRVPLRHPVDPPRDAHPGTCTSAHTLHGVPVAVGSAVLAVIAGTRVFRTPGA
ncbi:hypothetical protein ACWCQK_20905 [Streptomyces sp. NPDC002306]